MQCKPLPGVFFYGLLVSFSAAGQDYGQLLRQHDLKQYQLKGTVLGLQEQQWIPSPDSLFYSTAASFTPDNSYRAESSCDITFDTSGNVLTLRRSEPDERKRNEQKESSQVFYYRAGKLIAYAAKEKEQPDSVAYTYRKHGLIDHYTVFNGKGDLQYKMTYVYKNGRVATLRRNDKGNMPVAMIKYKYDGDRLTETQHFDEQYRLTETRRYSTRQMNDGEQNESYSVTGADGQMKSGLSLVKDKEGRILEQSTINGNREVTEYHKFVYDAQGLPVEEKVFSEVQEIAITNRYVYDDKGNWTKKEVFHNGQLHSVFLRKVLYNK